MFFKRLLILVMGLSALSQMQAQDYTDIISEIVEDVLVSNPDADYSDVSEELYALVQMPLDINKASKEELEQLLFLTDFQMQSLLEYREKYGDLVSIYELQTIYGYNPKTIRYLLPFISLGQMQVNEVQVRKSGHLLYTSYVNKVQKSIDDSDFEGARYSLRTKYNYHYLGKVYLGFNTDKDAGEALFSKSNFYGFDYNSLHLQMNSVGPFKRIVVGDYKASFGQGLVLWNGYSMGKSAYSFSVRQKSHGLQRYNSSDENIFFRGVGTTIRAGAFETSVFYSNKNRDAAVAYDSLIDQKSFTGFSGYGMHRTPGEIEKENAVNEKLVGGNLTFKSDKLRIGATMVHSRYNALWLPADDLYKMNDFSGNEISRGGIDYQGYLGKVLLYGEFAMDSQNKKAFLQGAQLQLSPKVFMSMLYRDYQSGYFTEYVSAFSENSYPANEKGLFTAFMLMPSVQWKVLFWFDKYSFPWMKYNVGKSSEGFEYLLRADYSPNESSFLYVQFKQEDKQVNAPADENPGTAITNSIKSSARVHFDYHFTSNLKMQTRAEFSEYNLTQKENGYLFYQQLSRSGNNGKIKFALRYTHFETDSYNTRIYVYENDGSYAFSFPFYYGTGNSFSAIMQIKPNYKTKVFLKYSLVQKEEAEDMHTLKVQGILRF